jgi:hypothetical protein
MRGDGIHRQRGTGWGPGCMASRSFEVGRSCSPAARSRPAVWPHGEQELRSGAIVLSGNKPGDQAARYVGEGVVRAACFVLLPAAHHRAGFLRTEANVARLPNARTNSSYKQVRLTPSSSDISSIVAGRDSCRISSCLEQRTLRHTVYSC